ncbi:MAG: hypothetical protein ALECFALPRED_010454 [Alectoria fallacina]|uniref:Uncharacterized protein n=1 Tax=Alectoria fallacina TaxID=1903189 RepID=A0A8H3PJP7_9LECA|nr:MAG: hypothetical protein ALECFALPRED_010454 [Alectoria fallacina]
MYGREVMDRRSKTPPKPEDALDRSLLALRSFSSHHHDVSNLYGQTNGSMVRGPIVLLKVHPIEDGKTFKDVFGTRNAKRKRIDLHKHACKAVLDGGAPEKAFRL